MPSQPSHPPAVIGTAGHVDHGKSTLVKALTGIDPDRLAEEKARAMTIDLGFAWLELPSGRQVSVVDVPGHERFIKNMLAGVGGIDAALLVVAADEGPMPQTAEHLAILDLLGVELGVVALTKADTVDGEWLDLISEEVRDRLAPTTLAGAPLVPVSALTGRGLNELRAALDTVLDTAPARPAGTKPRLPVDRVFTVAGFGTVVTGTLVGGELAVGQELRVAPHGRATRIRGLQTHQRKADRALPGSRVAVNLTGLAVEDIHRGDVLAPPGLLTATQRLDARLRLLPASPVRLEQNDEVDLFLGAAEVPARVTLLDRGAIEPGEAGWVQFRFRTPLAVLKGDRFIVRRPSPSETIGGGEIVDPLPPRHKRFRPEVVGALETLAAGSPDELVLQALEAAPRSRRELRSGVAGLAPEQVDAVLSELVAEGDAIWLGSDPADSPTAVAWVVATTVWHGIAAKVEATLAAFHAGQPLRKGMPREEVKSRLRLAPTRLFDDLVATAVARGLVVDDGSTLRLPGFAIALDRDRRAQADRWLRALGESPFAPPAPADYGLDPAISGALKDLGEVIEVGDGLYYDPEAYRRIVAETVALIDRDGTLTLAGFRDHFGTSRKYAQATLEHLDGRKITRRAGDERVRGVAAPKSADGAPSAEEPA
ncbi:MAG: selenocysteine-specific translation elongation factor [Chloroflexia bacterium]|nr:selenocysteine-specific translation elongation factor [Chloroflexia bacterium]